MNDPLIETGTEQDLKPTKLIRTQTGTPLNYRAKTMGARINKSKTVFQWTPDGKLKEITVVDDTPPPPSEQKPPSAFGKLSALGGKSTKSGFSGISATTTVVAFSEQDYPCPEGVMEGAKLGKVEGKPGIKKKNLVLIPLLTFLLFFVSSDAL